MARDANALFRDEFDEWRGRPSLPKQVRKPLSDGGVADRTQVRGVATGARACGLGAPGSTVEPATVVAARCGQEVAMRASAGGRSPTERLVSPPSPTDRVKAMNVLVTRSVSRSGRGISIQNRPGMAAVRSRVTTCIDQPGDRLGHAPRRCVQMRARSNTEHTEAWANSSQPPEAAHASGRAFLIRRSSTMLRFQPSTRTA